MMCPQYETADTITLSLDCEGCGKQMLVTIPLDRVEIEYAIRCPDCGPFNDVGLEV